MRIALEISTLFASKGITGIPRVCMKLAEHSPAPLSFIAGDRVVPDAIAREMLAKPGASPTVRRWLDSKPYDYADRLRLDGAIYPFWRVPRRLAKHETSIIMDLTPISHPDFHRETGMAELFEQHVLAPLPFSDRLICISQATQKTLRAWNARLGARATVAYCGQDWAFADPAPPATPRRFLCVGSVEPRKNLRLVIRWFLRSPSVRDDDQLQVIGGDGWGMDWNALLAEEAVGAPFAKRTERIERLGYVSDDALSAAYRIAYCLIYPSHFEGFGLPPLEAMAHGCPVIISDRGALPEVGGDAALYVRDLDDWNGIEGCLAELEIGRDRWVAAAMVRARAFTWKSFAESVFAGCSTQAQPGV